MKQFYPLIASVLCIVCTYLQADTNSPMGCSKAAKEMLDNFVGEWSINIEADEGWTGYGSSQIRYAPSLVCGTLETSDSMFNQESEAPVSIYATTLIAWDKLSNGWKVMSSDSRGYVHLGQNTNLEGNSLSFDIIRVGQIIPTRRIVYRDIDPEQFTWVWQGRAKEEETWKDRLVMKYKRL